MVVAFHGEPDEKGMLVDFRQIKKVVKPLIDQWDHTTLVAESDEELLHVLTYNGWRHFVLPFDSTAENLCRYAAEYIRREGRSVLEQHGINRVTVQIKETETSVASYSL